jgi:hypothetical protein
MTTDNPAPSPEDAAARAAAHDLFGRYFHHGLIEDGVITSIGVGELYGRPAVHVHIHSHRAVRLAGLAIPTEHMGVPVVVRATGPTRLLAGGA